MDYSLQYNMLDYKYTAILGGRSGKLAPEGASLPVGGLAWENAVPDPNDPRRATFPVPAPTQAPPDDFTPVGVAP